MTNLKEAKDKLNTAENEFIAAARSALKEALVEVFKNPDVENVVWGQRTTEYNDEGMSEGVHGPIINSDVPEVLGNGDSPYDSEDYDDLSGGSWGRTQHDVDNRESNLRTVLNEIGEKVLEQVVNVDGYEHFVIAVRANNQNGFTLTSEYVGY